MRRRSFQHVRHAALTSESLLLQVQTGAFFLGVFQPHGKPRVIKFHTTYWHPLVKETMNFPMRTAFKQAICPFM